MLRRSLRALSAPIAAGGKSWSKGSHRVTELPTGLKVVSWDDGSGAAGLGLFTQIGPRFEDKSNIGASLVLQKLMMKGNSFIQQPELSQRIALMGNIIRVTQHRECTCHLMQVPRYSVPEALDVLSAVALHIDPEPNDGFASAKDDAADHLRLALRDPTRHTFELIHQAAYTGVGLGLSQYPGPELMQPLTAKAMSDFHRTYVRPERTVVVASGITDHDAFVDEVQRHLKFPDPLPITRKLNATVYTGGQIFQHNTEAPESVAKFEEKNLTHIGLCFEGVPMTHPDYYALSVVQCLLGGGTSFSSGGPGKGMHTKLYREVVFREGWLHGMECVSAWYSDAGLIGLYASAPHEYHRQLLNTMIYQASTIPLRISQSHLEMAKNQLMSQLVLLGEQRDMLVEDTGKAMCMNNVLPVQEDLMAGAEKVTMEDLVRVSSSFVATTPTYCVYGNTESMPDNEQVTRYIEASVKKHTRA